MSELHQERGNSIIETSLTELAFIFFFILLIFSAWKISDISETLESKEVTEDNLQKKVKELQATLQSSSEFFSLGNDVSPEEMFQELIIGRKAVKELKTTKNELEQAKSSLSEIMEASDNNNVEDIKEELKAIDKAKDLMASKGVDKESFEKSIESLVQQNSNVKGQNINLRNKIKNLGNGLDHPPCWADDETGAIQYVFNVMINENSVEVFEGWPDKRVQEALNNPKITQVIGLYSTNESLWNKSNSLYQESVENECRHFVRIYDHADSKSSFKKYLLGIENHFYKYLSKDLYAKQ